MADEAPTQGANGANGTATEAAPARPTSRQSREASERAAREAFMSEVPDEYFAKAADAKPAPKTEAKPKPAAKPTAPADDAGDGADDDDPELELDDLDEDDDEADDELAAAADTTDADKDDEDTTRRLAKVRRTEQRMREQAAQRDRDFQAERQQFIAEWKPKVEAAQEFERLKARAKGDPLAVLQALGVGEDDLEEVSQILYGMSKAGQKDPKYKAMAMQLKQNRELREEVRTTQERLRAMEERSTQTAAQQENAAQAERYLARIVKSATDATPVLRAELEERPEATRARLGRLAIKLAGNGEFPDPKKVALAYEKARKRDIERAQALAGKLGGATPAAKPAAAKPAPIKVEDRTRPAAATPAAPVKTNGKSILPDRKSMIDNIHKLERGEITLDD